jgi:hypothetical protein
VPVAPADVNVYEFCAPTCETSPKTAAQESESNNFFIGKIGLLFIR